MTFRTRVAAATAVVVAIAVLLACGGRVQGVPRRPRRLRGSSLTQAYNQIYTPAEGPYAPQLTLTGLSGVGYVVVDQYGTPQGPSSSVGALSIVDTTVLRVAAGKAPLQFRTISDLQGNALRELVAPIPAGTEIPYDFGTKAIPMSALVIVEPFQGIETRLNSLEQDLLILAGLGILLAALFGFLAARAALVPLKETTREIEEVATTLDVSHRVEEGTNDELGRLRRAFNKLLAQVEASWESQRQLILDASHELRTPLTSLRANAQVLKRVGELDPEDAAQLSGDMVTQVDELTALVGDLTELTQGEHSIEEPADFDLADLVGECTEVAETHARTRRVVFEVTTSPCMVHARRNRMDRAVGNLLDNAIKFSPVDSTVAVSCTDGEVVVEDQGPGIDDEDQPRVFDRFYRSSRSRGLPGSGLGLAIVAQVASEAGGTVEVGRSETLGGARMVLRLPLA